MHRQDTSIDILRLDHVLRLVMCLLCHSKLSVADAVAQLVM